MILCQAEEEADAEVGIQSHEKTGEVDAEFGEQGDGSTRAQVIQPSKGH